jgi:predicted nucleotidyltransferase
MTLPEKLRRVLERTVKELASKENVYGVGLFGSWSRGTAEPSSDVDLFVMNKEDFEYEYVERSEKGGFYLDFDHVPKRWVRGQIPPEIDQKLCEMQILYDKDWTLANTKLWIAKSYYSSERIDIRTTAHVVDSDIFLSRATSALSRNDFESSYLFATVAWENTLRVLIEIAQMPYSNSSFLETAEKSAAKLGMQDLFNEYLEITGYRKVDDCQARKRLSLLKDIWDKTNSYTKGSLQTFISAHFKVRTRLNYYLNPSFLQGLTKRVSALIESGRTMETAHYLSSTILDLTENYVALKSAVNKVRVDYTTLIRSVEMLEDLSTPDHGTVLALLGLENVDKATAANVLNQTRKVMLKVRKDRKPLIKTLALKT